MRGIVATLVAAAVSLVLAGCGAGSTGAAPTSPPPAPTATASPTPVADVPIAAATPAPVRQPVPPVRVAVASIGVDVPVVPVGVEDGGFMEIPEDPAIGGWYRFGADPSSPDGNTVITAHVDFPGYPIGPFSRLRDLPAGEEVTVTDAAGTVHRYVIESVTYYPKADLPVNSLFARSGSDSLVLITCGGPFDQETGRYADNVVAVATAVE